MKATSVGTSCTPTSDGSGNIRDNLRKALTILRAAGWSVKNGVLTNDKTGKLNALHAWWPAGIIAGGLLSVLFFMAWIDRVNVGFAALQMNGDLGFSATVYGLGAGLFAALAPGLSLPLRSREAGVTVL